ncbi:hypothetical protein SAMN05216464_11025 [Mucilaginibacter pineti]|uniref:Uncharacterized protein n=1 Tax=Mucilaginibacter pineti TaxID=1391627 RepID=A0A1G7G8U6_9SPHI|nr:hypothetical protein [Mucilaginibacter pineti]SDE84523.1 hypothetical protein SAMN05216464_11025 [Mucilaginibacter pineti]
MNWTYFLFWLAGGYGIYYFVVVLSDLARSKRQGVASGHPHELTFSEQVTPVQPATQEIQPTKSTNKNEVLGSGGVPITDLFRLAKQEAIIYTRGVSF